MPSGRQAHAFVSVRREAPPSESAVAAAPAVLGGALGLALYAARCGILAAVRAYNEVARRVASPEMRVDE